MNIDYECRNNILQNPVNIANALFTLRNISPNITISFVAFSVVAYPMGWEDYAQAFVSIQPYINQIFWASYNINLNPLVADAWYSSANLTQITEFGYPLSSVFYGYCLGDGCAYVNGPSANQILTWAQSVKNTNAGGMFLWDLEGELLSLNNNITEFNTNGLSKQIADILHL